MSWHEIKNLSGTTTNNNIKKELFIINHDDINYEKLLSNHLILLKTKWIYKYKFINFNFKKIIRLKCLLCLWWK
jgi:hypothetical protein